MQTAVYFDCDGVFFNEAFDLIDICNQLTAEHFGNKVPLDEIPLYKTGSMDGTLRNIIVDYDVHKAAIDIYYLETFMERYKAFAAAHQIDIDEIKAVFDKLAQYDIATGIVTANPTHKMIEKLIIWNLLDTFHSLHQNNRVICYDTTDNGMPIAPKPAGDGIVHLALRDLQASDGTLKTVYFIGDQLSDLKAARHAQTLLHMYGIKVQSIFFQREGHRFYTNDPNLGEVHFNYKVNSFSELLMVLERFVLTPNSITPIHRPQLLETLKAT